jgi:hypothetical protein
MIVTASILMTKANVGYVDCREVIVPVWKGMSYFFETDAGGGVDLWDGSPRP